MDISIRIEGRAGRITLQRPAALNALTYPMVRAIDAAFKDWEEAEIDLVLIDAEGERAFCSGGDIAEMYARGRAGDFAYGQRFWRDEYRMNARIFAFPKPVVTFLQGFTMGGGVGVGCHGSHRIVDDSAQVAMPECGIGLVPDVGGSLILARAPGRLGEYLGTTATRMGPADAILAGFADYYVPRDAWEGLKTTLIDTGDHRAVDAAAQTAPDGKLPALRDRIDWHFGGEALGDILRSLHGDPSDFAQDVLKRMGRNSPLAMGCAVEIVHRLRGDAEGRPAIERALSQEYRFTHRALEHSDFLEGIRAAIIDKDRTPQWRDTLDGLNPTHVSRMLMPLGADALRFEDEEDTP